MTTPIKRVTLFVLLLAMMIGVAPPAADAKKKSLRTRIHLLEKRLAVLDQRVTDAQDSADMALAATDTLFGCIGALAIDPFTLPGTDPTLDQFPLGLSKAAVGAAPVYWVAIVDGTCLDPSTSGAAPRSFGARVRRLDRVGEVRP